MAAIVVSSDFEELAQVCDRVVVLRNGQICDEISGVRLDRHTLTELVLATGANDPRPEDVKSMQ
jgi:ribose transport system ATP-binding protein